ncbi:MAG: tRNA (adenosine(37)-N6)-dimethylallyltransferase MiaA [bacterium]|nr:tRNA (adenosine(37)-N6)-dimethylallyltransferase MiaA [bacterium]
MEKTVVVITGPTASGKTSLAIKLAKLFDGEIISADSRAIYKDIDIASAKPTIKEREGIVHWGFDLVEPGECFTAADFKEYAYEKIDDILDRGKIPFLVGGTGLYIDSVIHDYEFGGRVNEKIRNDLNKKSIEELQDYIFHHKIRPPENYQNKRYLVRSIEKSKTEKSRRCVKNNNYNFIVVGITTERNELRKRIFERNEQFFSTGIITETKKLAQKYGWESEAMTTNAYPLIREYLAGELTKSKLIEKMSTRDWRLAKRQITFMKRNKIIKWLSLLDADIFLRAELSKKL